jgi:hypothetical protein
MVAYPVNHRVSNAGNAEPDLIDRAEQPGGKEE